MQSAATNNSNKYPLLSNHEERPSDLINFKENNFAYNIIKEEQIEKSIEINNEEVIEFVKIAKGTFGTFRVKTEDNKMKEYYFIMYIVF